MASLNNCGSSGLLSKAESAQFRQLNRPLILKRDGPMRLYTVHSSRMKVRDFKESKVVAKATLYLQLRAYVASELNGLPRVRPIQ